MEELKSNPIIKFNNNQIQLVRKALGYDDVNKLKQDIHQLVEWIEMQNHFRVKEFDPEYLERLLIYNKGSIERTKQKFDCLCTYINLMPDYLQNFDIKNEFRPALKIIETCVLPKPTEDNYRVLMGSLTGKDDEDYMLIQYYRYHLLIGHYMLYNDYCQGYEWVYDIRNITMGFILKVNPIVVQKFFTLIVHAMGLRIKKIHVIVGSKLHDTAISLFKQGMSTKLKERLIIHPNIESLYAHVPKENLPRDYGGNELSLKELNDALFNELSSDKHIEQVKFMESASTDESRRLNCKFNEEYSGMPGSFKTLCVD